MPADTTSCLPSEMKAGVLAWVSRPDLLSMGLVSRDWREAARTDMRFYILVKLQTYPNTTVVVELLRVFEEVAAYAVEHRFWIKFVLSLARRSKMDDFEHYKRAGPLSQRFALWLERGLERTVSIQVHGPSSAWNPIESGLNSGRAPVLHTLELSGLYGVPKGTRKRNGLKPARLTPLLFKGHAPFLRSLALKEVPVQKETIPAFSRVQDLSLVVTALQGVVGLGKHAAVTMSSVFPSVRNLEIRLQSIPEATTRTSHLMLDLTQLQLESLVTTRSADMVDAPQCYIMPPAVPGYLAPTFWWINHNTEGLSSAQLESVFTPLLNTQHTYSLNMLQSSMRDDGSEPTFDCYFALHDEVTKFQRMYGYSRSSGDQFPDPDQDGRLALSLCNAQLVSLSIDVGYIPALVAPRHTKYPQLKVLDIQLLNGWHSWPTCAIPDAMAFTPPSRKEFNPTRNTLCTPQLAKVMFRSVGVRGSVTPEVIDALACHLQLPNPHRERQPTLELHSTLVVNLPAKFNPFLGFDRVVAYPDSILPPNNAFALYGAPDTQMGEDWRTFGATKVY